MEHKIEFAFANTLTAFTEDQAETFLGLILSVGGARTNPQILAQKLLKHFGNYKNVLTAPAVELLQIPGITPKAVEVLKGIFQTAFSLIAQELTERPLLNSPEKVGTYCRILMSNLDHEQIRGLFLNQHHYLIKEEILQIGSASHITIYPREIAKRTLEIGATGLILAHNHPSDILIPSEHDIKMTLSLLKVLKKIEIDLVDHIIVGKTNFLSLKNMGFI